mmetsp:Transcript_9198/g.11815  ORF Transcript_9198/g.11815 Transcript_9198/m.11815 type:complete len:206 (-) Transcript_9198:445-1062(-)
MTAARGGEAAVSSIGGGQGNRSWRGTPRTFCSWSVTSDLNSERPSGVLNFVMSVFIRSSRLEFSSFPTEATSIVFEPRESASSSPVSRWPFPFSSTAASASFLLFPVSGVPSTPLGCGRARGPAPPGGRTVGGLYVFFPMAAAFASLLTETPCFVFSRPEICELREFCFGCILLMALLNVTYLVGTAIAALGGQTPPPLSLNPRV